MNEIAEHVVQVGSVLGDLGDPVMTLALDSDLPQLVADRLRAAGCRSNRALCVAVAMLLAELLLAQHHYDVEMFGA
jgi:hypothetical protein